LIVGRTHSVVNDFGTPCSIVGKPIILLLYHHNKVE
jgi:hypothetical protein